MAWWGSFVKALSTATWEPFTPPRSTASRRDRSGHWLRAIGRPGRGAGELIRPKQVCVTPSGLIAVADAGRQSVMLFDAGGRFLPEIGEARGGWHGFTLPMGVTLIDPAKLSGLADVLADAGMESPGACILVSDTLSEASVTVLGIVVGPAAEVDGAR